MQKNLNPLYEGHFLADHDPKLGKKLFKNGLKKNGFFTTLSRNKKAALKRGLHKAKSMDSALAVNRSDEDTKTLISIGKRATKGEHLSSQQAEALKRGYA